MANEPVNISVGASTDGLKVGLTSAQGQISTFADMTNRMNAKVTKNTQTENAKRVKNAQVTQDKIIKIDSDAGVKKFVSLTEQGVREKTAAKAKEKREVNAAKHTEKVTEITTKYEKEAADERVKFAEAEARLKAKLGEKTQKSISAQLQETRKEGKRLSTEAVDIQQQASKSLLGLKEDMAKEDKKIAADAKQNIKEQKQDINQLNKDTAEQERREAKAAKNKISVWKKIKTSMTKAMKVAKGFGKVMKWLYTVTAFWFAKFIAVNAVILRGLRGLTKYILASTEDFTKYTIMLKGAMKDSRVVEALMKSAYRYAIKSPLRMSEALKGISGFAVMPTIKPLLADLDKLDKNVNRIMDTALGLVTLRPDRGIDSALFALRHGLAGQFRSLQFRFGLLPRFLAATINASVSEIKKSPEKFMEALEVFIERNVGRKALDKLSKQFTSQVDKIRDIFYMGAVQIGRSGFYEAVSDQLFKVVMQLSEMIGSNSFELRAQRISNALISFMAVLEDIASKSTKLVGKSFFPQLEALYGDDTIGMALEMSTRFIEDYLGKFQKLPDWIQNEGKGVIDFLGKLFKIIKAIADFTIKMTKTGVTWISDIIVGLANLNSGFMSVLMPQIDVWIARAGKRIKQGFVVLFTGLAEAMGKPSLLDKVFNPFSSKINKAVSSTFKQLAASFGSKESIKGSEDKIAKAQVGVDKTMARVRLAGIKKEYKDLADTVKKEMEKLKGKNSKEFTSALQQQYNLLKSQIDFFGLFLPKASESFVSVEVYQEYERDFKKKLAAARKEYAIIEEDIRNAVKRKPPATIDPDEIYETLDRMRGTRQQLLSNLTTEAEVIKTEFLAAYDAVGSVTEKFAKRIELLASQKAQWASEFAKAQQVISGNMNPQVLARIDNSAKRATDASRIAGAFPRGLLSTFSDPTVGLFNEVKDSRMLEQLKLMASEFETRGDWFKKVGKQLSLLKKKSNISAMQGNRALMEGVLGDIVGQRTAGPVGLDLADNLVASMRRATDEINVLRKQELVEVLKGAGIQEATANKLADAKIAIERERIEKTIAMQEQELKAQTDLSEAFVLGWKKHVDAMKRWWEQIGDFSQQAFERITTGVEDILVEGLVKGTSKIRDIFWQMILDIETQFLKMLMRMMMNNIMKSLFGNFLSPASVASSTSVGAAVSNSATKVGGGFSSSLTPPRLASGTPMVTKSGMAFLHKGEKVDAATATSPRSGDAGSDGKQPDIYVINTLKAAELVKAGLPPNAIIVENMINDSTVKRKGVYQTNRKYGRSRN